MCSSCCTCGRGFGGGFREWSGFGVLVSSFLSFPGIAEHFSGFCESPADGGFGAVGDGGDISRAEAFEVAEDEDGAIGFREFEEYALDLHGDFVALGGGGGGVREPVFGAGGEGCPAAAALLSPEMIAGEVDGESEQPGAEASGRVELLQSLEGAEEGFLGEVSDRFAIEDESLDHFTDASFVAEHQLSEGFVVALAGEVHEACFAAGVVCGGSILSGGMQVEWFRIGHADHTATPFTDQLR
ncbi:MAG: hypothetical protein RLZZ436_3831 [Planctomycetota bacterium]